MATTKRVKLEAGQMFATPLIDGTFGLAHLALVTPLKTVIVLLASRAKSIEALAKLAANSPGEPIAVIDVTENAMKSGEWPLVGKQPAQYPAGMLDTHGKSSTHQRAPRFLEGFFGVRPWNKMGPKDDDNLLLPGVKRPKPASAKAAPRVSPPVKKTEKKTPTITKGPGTLHVEIRYPGDDLPSVALVKRRHALEKLIEKHGAGEVTDSGGGEGVMDIYLDTDDVKRALPIVKEAVAEMGFADDATIEVEPPDEDGEDGDPN